MSIEIFGSCVERVHFVGIGGISMSGLAKILLRQGCQISGSDMHKTEITEKLEKDGATIFYGHSAQNIQNPDLVVYTAAVKSSNPEIIAAKEKNITLIDRAALLGEIMKLYNTRITVSGTHGKTTTTSMISVVMLKSGLNPTIHLGGILEQIGGNTYVGSRKHFITEACEYVESFLKFSPNFAIILNIEPDHLDFFKDLEHIKRSFSKFVLSVPQDGTVVINMDDENVAEIANKLTCTKITYGLHSNNTQWSAKNISFDKNGYPSFDVVYDKKTLAQFKLSIPGIHNIYNALACISACYYLGCDLKDIREALEEFPGVQRRFELKGIVNNIKVIDDYAHHPTEVTATLKAARNCSQGKIFCVFQPHTYTRTKALLGEFAKSFTLADKVIVTDIYAAREQNTGIIHSRVLTERINSYHQNAVYISSFKDIVSYLENNSKSGDLIITMGAGDVNKVAELFLSEKKAAG